MRPVTPRAAEVDCPRSAPYARPGTAEVDPFDAGSSNNQDLKPQKWHRNGMEMPQKLENHTEIRNKSEKKQILPPKLGILPTKIWGV